MRMRVALGLQMAWLSAPMVLAQEPWTVEELRENAAGFQIESYEGHLQQIAGLLEHRKEAFSAVCSFIRGDHREYRLNIERLLGQLQDHRWAVREGAERQLVEIGARAFSVIQERAKNGKALEERIRCSRIADKIATRGLEEQEVHTELLRGLVRTAAHFEPDERLASALVSATGYPDAQVVDGAIRALGFVGSDQNASFLLKRFRTVSKNLTGERGVVLGSLATLRGEKAGTLLEQLVTSGDLTQDESIGLVLDLSDRSDRVGVLNALANVENKIVSSLAQQALEESVPVTSGPGPRAIAGIADTEGVAGTLLAVRSDGVELKGVGGLDRLRVPSELVGRIDFEGDGRVAPPGSVRIFTTQGSLLIGILTEIDAKMVRFESALFGKLELPRDKVQGIAFEPEFDRLVGSSPTSSRLRKRGPGSEFVDGEILAVDADEFSMRSSDGAEFKVARKDIAVMMFRRPPPSPNMSETFARVALKSGDRLLVYLSRLDRSVTKFIAPGLGKASLPTTELESLELGASGGALWGFTLVADYSENSIVEFDAQHQRVFVLPNVYSVWDVECLDNGNFLVVEFSSGRVVELTRDGREVWKFEDLKNPYDADRLRNGNTLIADTYGGRVIEVAPNREIVWTYDNGVKPHDVQRLANGNTLIADRKHDRVFEVDPKGKVVWELPDMEGVWDADRLPNGNTLIAQRSGSDRVLEVDRNGTIVLEIRDLDSPSDADRLPNGHTLIAETEGVREFDRFGKEVRRMSVSWAVEVNRY